MVYLARPYLPSDLAEEDVVVLEKSRASKAPSVKQSPEQKLRVAGITNKSLHTVLNKESLIAAEAKLNALNSQLAQELRDKEIEHKKIVADLQDQLNEARGQLYGVGILPTCQSFHGTFLDDPDCPEIIAEAGLMVQKEKYQHALVHLDTNISARDSTTLHANATLLKSSILRISDEPRRGLELAEHVVYIASLNDLPTLLGKAQLYRGLCLFDLGLYADASRCYVRAASICWFAREVTNLTAIAEKRTRALPNGSRGKHLSPDFHEIPLSIAAKGFGSSPMKL